MFKEILNKFKTPKKSIIEDLTETIKENKFKLEYEIFVNLKRLYGEKTSLDDALKKLEYEIKNTDELTLGRLCEIFKMKRMFEEYQELLLCEMKGGGVLGVDNLMYFQAKIYIDAVPINTIVANSVDVLKIKCEPFIKDKKITTIEVSEVNDLGYFKLPKEIEKVIGKEAILWG